MDYLKEARLKKGLSVIQVANMLGIDRTTYWRYENKEVKQIPYTNLLKLKDILDIDLEEFMKNREA